MRLTLPLLAAALAVLAACSRATTTANKVEGDLRVTIEQKREGPWRVTYELANPRAELDLGYDIDGFRATNWEIETKGAMLLHRDLRDVVVPIDGRRHVRKFTFLVDPKSAGLRKDYEPFIPMGDGGVIFYSGHFIPFRDKTTRLDARLTIIADEGAAVSAFGNTRARFDDWRSPLDHPAFIYVGREKPTETDTLATIADATAPDWIKSEVATFAPAIASALQEIFARALPTKPNIFVAMGDLSEAGRLSYSGDALPGQYQMTLAGGGWKEPSEKALGVLRLATAYEAAHLWQAAARPASDAVPDWIHEGGADALAAQAMVKAGYWTLELTEENFTRVKADCARLLEMLSLQRAEAENRWEAVYACGHVLTVAAAGKQGVAAFWREFVIRAAREGYDEAMFLALAEERAGDDTAKSMRDLIRINDARPDIAIARMVPPASDLAAGQGR